MADKKAPSGRKSAAAPGDKAKAGKSAPGADTPPASSADKAPASKAAGKSPAKPSVAKTSASKTAADKTAADRTPADKTATDTAQADKAPADKTPADTSRADTSAAAATGADKTTRAGSAAPIDAAQAAAPVSTSIPASGTRSSAPGADDKPSGTASAPEPARAAEKSGATPATGPGDKPATEQAAAKSATATPPTFHAARQDAAAPTRRRGGFVPLLLGGVCAAAIGFGAAYYLFPQMGLMTPAATAGDQTAAALAEQSDRIAALDARIDAIPGAPDTSGIEAGQVGMATQISDLSRQVSALTERVADLESQPAGAGGDSVTTGQLNELRRTIKAQGDQIARLVAEAEKRDSAARAAARQDLRRAAMTRIRTALDTGTPFAAALGDLERAGMSTPDALQEVAEAGVPTQSALQQSFAPAARAALAKARRSGEDGTGDVWSFLSSQLGARSLERREGPGTDAVLSRAEDDLRQGDLAAALSEVETLPEPAAAELSDWAARARARMEAVAAYDALAEKLN